MCVFFFKQKTAYEMRISDWSSDVCSSDLHAELEGVVRPFDGFSVTASGTYLDATYRGFFTGNGTIDNSGNRVQRQPRWTWRVKIGRASCRERVCQYV